MMLLVYQIASDVVNQMPAERRRMLTAGLYRRETVRAVSVSGELNAVAAIGQGSLHLAAQTGR